MLREKSDQETCKRLDCTSGKRHSEQQPTCKHKNSSV